MKKIKTKAAEAREDARTTTTENVVTLAELPKLAGEKVENVNVDSIDASPFQPRKEFPEEEMAELCEHIRANGIQIPLLGRPSPKDKNRIELIAGERRYRSAKALKLETVPMIVRELTDEEVIRIQRAENAGRENLKALEAAEDYVLLANQGKSVEEICALHGVKRSHVFTRMRVAKLPEEIRQLVKAGKLSITHADLIAKLPTAEMQTKAAKEISTGAKEWSASEGEYIVSPMSFRAAQDRIAEGYQCDLSKATFDVKKIYSGDVKRKGSVLMLFSRGNCVECPHRTGNCKDLYPDQKNPNICTEPDCFAGKAKADTEEKLAGFKARGIEILPATATAKIFPRYGGDGPGWNSGYVTLDQTHNMDKEDRTYAKLLKGQPLPAASVAMDAKGVPHVLYKETDMTAALVKAGHKFAVKEKKADAKQSADREKEKAETELRKQVLAAAVTQVRAKAEKLAGTEAGQLKLLRWLFAELDDQFYNTTTKERMDKLKLPAAWGLGALLVIEEESSNHYGRSYPSCLVTLAELIGIDLKAEEKKVKEAKPPKAAKKGGRK